MTDTENGYRFERSHEILINAEPDQVLNYVSNPQSWPQWINPARPKPITQKMIDAIDKEAAACLENIKRNVEGE